ncbi:MAG: substrate-binding domain-containing protein [Thermodesulfobacteriota bacterium]
MRVQIRHVLVCLLVLSAGCLMGECSAEEAQKLIKVNGAGMASDQVMIWANEFMASNPGVHIVVTGSSAGKGFEALIERRAEIALSSRPVRSEESDKATGKGMKLDSKLIGFSGLAVFTSPRNPVSELTFVQLREIFSGERTNWKDLGGPDIPIRCLTRRIPESGGAMFFMEKVLQNRFYGPTTMFAETWRSIIRICATATDLPIGMGPAFIVRDDAKVLGIKKDEASPALKPTDETLRNQTYPLINPIHVYWDSLVKDAERDRFIAFCVSKGLPK